MCRYLHKCANLKGNRKQLINFVFVLGGAFKMCRYLIKMISFIQRYLHTLIRIKSTDDS